MVDGITEMATVQYGDTSNTCELQHIPEKGEMRDQYLFEKKYKTIPYIVRDTSTPIKSKKQKLDH